VNLSAETSLVVGFSHKEIEYIVAHKGLFQRAPIPEAAESDEFPRLFRAVLDRSLLDYIKGPNEVGKDFYEVSAWLYDKPIEDEYGDMVQTGDFAEVCNLAAMQEDTVAAIFRRFRCKV